MIFALQFHAHKVSIKKYYKYIYIERKTWDWPDLWERFDGDDVSIKVSPSVQVEQAESHQVAQVTEQQK